MTLLPAIAVLKVPSRLPTRTATAMQTNHLWGCKIQSFISSGFTGLDFSPPEPVCQGA
jgi:hypothetical protein